jgi:hypothetical protein
LQRSCLPLTPNRLLRFCLAKANSLRLRFAQQRFAHFENLRFEKSAQKKRKENRKFIKKTKFFLKEAKVSSIS